MKKLLIFILALTLSVTLFSVSAFAEEGEAAPPAETEAEAEGAEATAFSLLYSAILDNLDKILAGASLVGTALILFAYKRGFLPLVSRALAGLSGSVKKLSDESEKQTGAAAELLSAVDGRLKKAESLLLSLSETLADYEKKLPEIEREQGERAVLRTVLEGEVDLFSDVLMSSSLPQYRKDEIGERVAAMRGKIREAEDASDAQKD